MSDDNDPYGERFFADRADAYNKRMNELDKKPLRDRKDCSCLCHTTDARCYLESSLFCCTKPEK